MDDVGHLAVCSDACVMSGKVMIMWLGNRQACTYLLRVSRQIA
jgi:hypothetical protein